MLLCGVPVVIQVWVANRRLSAKESHDTISEWQGLS